MIVLRNKEFSNEPAILFEEVPLTDEEQKDLELSKKKEEAKKERKRFLIAGALSAATGAILYRDSKKESINKNLRDANYPEWDEVRELLYKKHTLGRNFLKNHPKIKGPQDLKKKDLINLRNQYRKLTDDIDNLKNNYVKRENRKNAALGALAGAGLVAATYGGYKLYKHHRDKKKEQQDDNKN